MGGENGGLLNEHGGRQPARLLDSEDASLQTQVLIIGGGITGVGVARDLALRGVPCLLVERRDLVAGASGGNHGLLHSGARYAASDPPAARQCASEGEILRQVVPQCIEDTGGLFVAVAGDDEHYIADFPALCAQSGVIVEELDPRQAREMEPALSEQVIAAFAVRDATIDPFMLTLETAAHAQSLGAEIRVNTEVESFVLDEGRIRQVILVDHATGRSLAVEPEVVVNATGAWAGKVLGLAGVEMDLLCSKGSLLVTQRRLTQRVVNRLRRPTDADILVPGGTVSILGTTSQRIDDPDLHRPTVEEADCLIQDAAAMIPELQHTRYIRAYAGVRPLFGGNGSDDDRSVSRGMALLDHAREGIHNLITITGGKLTTYRLMAEETSDLVCRKLGVKAPCLTRTELLPSSARKPWTQPAASARAWALAKEPGLDSDKVALCECEVVSRRIIDSIVSELAGVPSRQILQALSLRSRVGKGSCQGSLCSLRITGHLYDQDLLAGRDGLAGLKTFLAQRWRGVRPVSWGATLVQAELQEALHCGLLGLELEDAC